MLQIRAFTWSISVELVCYALLSAVLPVLRRVRLLAGDVGRPAKGL